MTFFEKPEQIKKNTKIRTFLLYLTSGIVILGGLTLFYFNFVKSSEAVWYDDSWSYRKAITVTVSTSTSDITDLETFLTIDTQALSGKIQGSCQDLRFTNINGKVLPYYIDSGCGTTSTKVWVMVDLVPKNTTTYIMYMYYGNPTAPAGSNENTFRLFKGLVSYWPMNEGTSTTAADVGVNGYDGTLTNGPTWGTGKYSNGVVFNGVQETNGDVILAGDQAAYELTTFTVSGWINRAGACGFTDCVIFAKGMTGNIGYSLEALSVGGNYTPQLSLRDSLQQVQATTTIGTGTWYHVAASIDGTTVKVYVNGVLEKEAAQTQTPTYSTEQGKIGNRNNNTDITMNGTLDDVRLYNRALSAAEIRQLYDSPGTIASTAVATSNPSAAYGAEQKGPTPVLYWKFNDGTGTNAQDSTSQNNDGTTSGPTWEPGGVASGKGEFSLKFDGSNDLVSKTYSSDTELDPASSNMSVSVWARHSSTAPAASTTDTIIARFSSGGYKVYMNESGYFCFGVDDDATWSPDFSACSGAPQGSYADSKWHFIEGVKDASSTITLFIDGQQISQTSLVSFGSISGSSPTFYAGIDSDGTSNPWDGLIDDVKVFTSEQSVRSAAQVKADYTARSTADGASAVLGQDTSQTNLVSGLVGWWKMDESSGNPADSSGNALTLTNNGVTTFVGGKFANGSNHNGTTQYFSTATAISGVQTVAFWVNPASTTDNYINLIASTAYINSSSGTVSATGFTSPSIYVNGVLNGTITASVWNHVAVTTGTAISASAFEAGRANGSYLTNTGKLDEVRVYNRALSPAEVASLYSFAPGPVGWWKMDENTGTGTGVVKDSSGNGNNLDMQASMTNSNWVPGKFGSALNFDGTDDYATITNANQTGLGITGPLTIEAWARVDTLGATIVIAGKSGATPNAGYNIRMSSGNFFTLALSNDGTTTTNFNGNTTVSANTWYHVAGVYDGSTVNLYVNGVSDLTPTAYSSGIFNNTAVFNIGARNNGTQPWDGLVDDVRIYNYARTGKQIIEDMNAGHPAPGSPVGSAVAHWKMDEGSLNTCSGGTNDFCDSSINVNDLAFSTTTGGFTNSGKFRKAFDGTGAVWASRADDADFDFAAADDASFSFWFKSDNAANPASGSDEYLLTKGTITNTGTVGYAIYADNNGKVNFGIRSTSGAWGASSPGTPSPDDTTTSTSDIYDNTWHNIVAVKTGTSRIDLYVDGKLDASDTSLTAIGSLANSITSYFADDDGDSANSFNGDIDEVKIFRSALTSDQVKLLYNQSSAVVWGAVSTDSSGNPSFGSDRSYCPPGDSTSSCAPVGEWKMDEGTGTAVNDSSGNSTAGSFGGNPTWGIGKLGSAIRFDGTGDFVNANSATILDDLAQFTAEAWMRPNAASGGNERLIGKNGANDTGWMLQYDSSERLWFGVDYDITNLARQSSNNVLVPDQWQHVAVTWNGSATATNVRFYINGAETTYGTTTNGNTNRNTDNTQNLCFGSRCTSALGEFTGLMDDVRIYNYVRTPAQIAWDYNYGKPVGHWKFDECQGVTANDSAGNSLSGTISAGAGGITSVGDCSTATTMWDNGESGKWNYSLDFDLIDDNVSVTNANAIDFDTGLNNGFSMAAWVYADSAGESNVGRFIDKGTNTYCRTDNPSGSNLDIECQLDLTTTDRNVNISSAFTTGSWNHIAFTWTNDSDDDVTVYINGKSRGSSSTNSNDTVPSDANNLTIGNNSAGSATFDGKIDDVRIYNYELTSNQVRMLFNQGSAVRYGPVTGAP